MLVLLLALAFPASGDDPFYFKTDDVVDIKIPCLENKTQCSSDVTCNISIVYPNGRSYVSNGLMSKNGVYYNYTINDSSVLGDYQCIMLCTDTLNSGFGSFVFQINNIGKKIGYIMPMIVFFVVLICVFLLLFVWLLAKRNPLMYPTLLVISGLFTLLFFYTWMNTIELAGLFYAFYRVSLILFFVMMVLVLWEATLLYVKRWSKSAQQKQNFNDNV